MQRDEGLAGADVSLEQQVHRLRTGHPLADLVHRAELRARRLERQARAEALGERGVRVVRDTPLRSASRRCLRNPTPSSSVKSSSNFSRSRASASSTSSAGKWIRRRAASHSASDSAAITSGGSGSGCAGSCSRARPDQLADGVRRDAFRRRMHGRDPRRVHQLLLRAAEDLDLLVRHLEPAAVELRDARDRELHARAIAIGGPRLVEEREIQEPGAVGERHGHHRPSLPGLPFRDRSDGRDHGGLGADLQAADRGDAGAIDVAPRVVVQQLADGLDAERLREHLLRLGALRPRPRAPGREPAVDLDDRGGERQRHRGLLTLEPVLPWCRDTARRPALGPRRRGAAHPRRVHVRREPDRLDPRDERGHREPAARRRPTRSHRWIRTGSRSSSPSSRARRSS